MTVIGISRGPLNTTPAESIRVGSWETPRKLTPEQETLLRKLAELEHKNVLPERKNFLERIKDYFATTEAGSS